MLAVCANFGANSHTPACFSLCFFLHLMLNVVKLILVMMDIYVSAVDVDVVAERIERRIEVHRWLKLKQMNSTKS